MSLTPSGLEQFFQLLWQLNGVDLPRRPIANVVGSGITDDPTNNRVNLTLGGGSAFAGPRLVVAVGNGVTTDLDTTGKQVVELINGAVSATFELGAILAPGAGDGTALVLINATSYTCTLQHAATGHPGNFNFTLADLPLPPNEGAFLVYDTTLAQWRVLFISSTGTSTAGRLATHYLAHGDTLRANTINFWTGSTTETFPTPASPQDGDWFIFQDLNGFEISNPVTISMAVAGGIQHPQNQNVNSSFKTTRGLENLFYVYDSDLDGWSLISRGSAGWKPIRYADGSASPYQMEYGETWIFNVGVSASVRELHTPRNPQPGDEFTVKIRGSFLGDVGVTITTNGDGNDLEDPASADSYTDPIVAFVEGFTVTWRYDGVNGSHWMIVSAWNAT